MTPAGRRTKLVATLGPASSSPETLRSMIDAGLDVARLNLSHGSLDEHLERLELVRRLAAEAGRHVAILADLPGPKLRAGEFVDGPASFVPGALVSVVADDVASSATLISVDYPTLEGDLGIGDRIVLGDGAISMRVVADAEHRLLAEVMSGGITQGRPGVHLSCARLQLHSPTAEDLVAAERVAAAGVDFIALSFARTGADVDELRAVVGDRARLMAKIETAGAIERLAEIASAADAIMVARGDLGIDCPLEDVPHLQKRIIRYCAENGVPVVTATQMLESMIAAPAPTRAEVTDVANAVFDGTDAVMLSGETAIGHDPALVLRTMATIAVRAEVEADYRQWGFRLGRLAGASRSGDVITDAVTHAAWQAAADVGAAAIICCTRTGRTARSMARFRPEAQLLALSPDERTLAGLALSWGVESMSMDESDSTDDMVWIAVERAVAAGRLATGDTAVVVAGAPNRTSGAAADVMRIVTVR